MLHWLPIYIVLATLADDFQQQQIGRLIVQLGTEAFADREAATNDLLRIGGAALRQLEKATLDADAERSKRSSALIERIYAQYFSQDFHKLPGITYLSIHEFANVGEQYLRRATDWAIQEGIPKEKVIFGLGFGMDRVATKEYLRDQVKTGASKERIQQIIDEMGKRRKLVLPIERDPDYELVKDRIKRARDNR